MIKIAKMRPLAERPLEYYEGTASEAIVLGEALVLSSGKLTKCGATDTPEFISMGSGTGVVIPVVRVMEEDVYSATLSASGASLNVGDKVMGMNLSHGGHLTHGHPINFSGLDYNIVSYDVDLKTEMLDYDEIEALALKEKPKMIIAGASAYSRFIDFKRFRSIADKCGAYMKKAYELIPWKRTWENSKNK